MQKSIKNMLPAIMLLLAACTKSDIPNQPSLQVTVPEYSFDTDVNSKLIFQDNEIQDSLTSAYRQYEIGKVLQVKPVNKTTIAITNFAPVDIDSATIMLYTADIPQPVKLLYIKKIRAHATQQIEYPFIKGDTSVLGADGNIISLAKYKSEGIEPARAGFDFTGNTILITKLKKLAKLKWQVKYHDYDPNDNTADNWKENIAPKDVRRFSGLIINLAYLFQANETQTAFVAEPITGNDGVTFLTSAQKEKSFDDIINKSYFQCGVVVNVSGLGGGPVFGVANHVLNDYLKKDVCFITTHEIGHMIGYNHSSTMTYPKNNQGATVATGKIYNAMLSTKDFPVRSDNYYRTSDF